jgi:hypothetical protein
LRIDYVGREYAGDLPGVIGFEIKRGDSQFLDFGIINKALAQCEDYTQSIIQPDARFIGEYGQLVGQPIRHTFLFACPYQIYEIDGKPRCQTCKSRGYSQRDGWTQGILRHVGLRGVGAITYIPRKDDWLFLLGGQTYYWLKTGPTKLAIEHRVGERKGASR